MFSSLDSFVNQIKLWWFCLMAFAAGLGWYRGDRIEDIDYERYGDYQ